MRTLRCAVLGASAVVLVTAVSSCSSSGGSGSSATDTSAAPSAASPAASSATPSAAPITVGAICSCSGGTFGGQHEALYDVYDAWVKTTNAAGGINGHPIDLVKKDDAANPANAITAAQSLVSSKVDAIVDLSLVDGAWAKTVDEAGIPVVGSDVADEVFMTDPNFYPEGQTPESTADALMATAKQAGAKSVGILYCVESESCQQLVPAQKTAAEKAGLKVAYVSSISATAPNYTAQCLAAKQAGVDALLVFHGAQVIARIGPDCKQQDYTPIYITEGQGFGAQMLSAAGINDTLWSVFSDIPYFATTPAVKTANAAIDKYYPSLRKDVDNWSQLAFESWVSGLLLQEAVKASGLGPSDTPSAATIVKGLHELKGTNLDGTAPSLSFTNDGKPNSVDCWFIGRLRNGGKTSVANNGKPTCPSR